MLQRFDINDTTLRFLAVSIVAIFSVSAFFFSSWLVIVDLALSFHRLFGMIQAQRQHHLTFHSGIVLTSVDWIFSVISVSLF